MRAFSIPETPLSLASAPLFLPKSLSPSCENNTSFYWLGFLLMSCSNTSLFLLHGCSANSNEESYATVHFFPPSIMCDFAIHYACELFDNVPDQVPCRADFVISVGCVFCSFGTMPAHVVWCLPPAVYWPFSSLTLFVNCSTKWVCYYHYICSNPVWVWLRYHIRWKKEKKKKQNKLQAEMMDFIDTLASDSQGWRKLWAPAHKYSRFFFILILFLLQPNFFFLLSSLGLGKFVSLFMFLASIFLNLCQAFMHCVLCMYAQCCWTNSSQKGFYPLQSWGHLSCPRQNQRMFSPWQG